MQELVFIKAKKSLGQCFLKDEDSINFITNQVASCQSEVIFEIGPGEGAITRGISKLNKLFFVIEKDEYLASKLPLESKQIIVGDVLLFDWNAFLDKYSSVTVVSNLPYNISVPIFLQLIKLEKVKEMILMFQKEVAEKFVSLKSNSLMILSGNYLHVKLLRNLPPHFFWPVPKVYSSIILATRKKGEISLAEFDKLEKFLRMLYKHKRKQLKNVIGIDSKVRAEALNLEEVIALYRKIHGN